MGIIKQLDKLVAQRIAAGEVIERPASVVRELIDNSIDADASAITLYIEGGGIDRIKLVDNGKGISEEDLPLTVCRHATSKISTLDDLYHLHSLGFRGEALYSVAAVSRLTIESAVNGMPGHRYTVDNADEGVLSPSGITEGTQITVEDLFFHIPARKNFLKRAQSEAKLCRQTLIQKALSSPSVHYMFYSDGALKLDLPAKDNLFDRVLDVLTAENNFAKGDFITAEKSYDGFSISLVASKPSLYRSDRSGIKIYLNKRQIDEFSLVQAVSFGYGELLPGGSFPYAAVFVEDDPEMVDFNIHPAKREAKIRNLATVHHALSTLVKDSIPRTFNTFSSPAFEQPFLSENIDNKAFKSSFATESFPPVPPPYHGKEDFKSPLSVFERSNFKTEERPSSPSWLEKAKEMAKREENFVPRESDSNIWNPLKEESFTYIGQAFNLFLIAEKDGKLYLVDQHAAHERIIYDRLKAQTDVQKLLVPIEFEVSADTDAFLQENSDLYTSFGIMISRKEDKLWLLTSIPSICRPIEKQILEFIQTRTGDLAELESALYAIIACKAAIKAGDKCDVFTAKAILEEVFKMKDPACPHGRTFLVILSEEELRKMVGRTN